MHRIIRIVLLIASVAPAGAQSQGPAAGIVVSAGAGAFLERGRARVPLALGELIYAGDRLVTAGAGATLLFCPTTERITLGAQSTAEVTRDAVAVRKGPAATRAKANQCALPQVALGKESMERIGGYRARGFPPLPLYFGGPVRGARPVFEWAAIAGVESYRLVLRSESGNDVWETETRTPRAEYPASQPQLQPGTYNWEVKALAGGKTLAQQNADFELRAAAPSAGAAPADAAARLVAAVAAENEGYWAEAAAHYRALRADNPGDLRLARRLAWLYQNAGLFMAADDELKKAAKAP